MNNFRRLCRHSWPLHAYLILSMVFCPMPQIGAYWTRDSNGEKISIQDPDSSDSWMNEDSDNDTLTNGEEVIFGSDPYNPDSEYDGLTDRDERDLTPAMLAYTSSTDPWNWDSDNDGYSDHDEYWSYITGKSLNVNYTGRDFPSPVPFTYFKDLDGDGRNNLDDYDPEDPQVFDPPPPIDSDGDGCADSNDSDPNISSLWSDWNRNGINDHEEIITYDSDSDGHDDQNDSHPNDSLLWEDWNYNGINDSYEVPPTDSDADGHADYQDSDPNNANLWDDWNRNGYNDSNENADSDQDDVTDIDEYANGTNPVFHDSDGDGLSDGEERTALTNPLQVDSDADGLTDYEEIMIYGTNPILARTNSRQAQVDYYHVNHADSDADGIPDLVEIWYGRDPSSAMDGQSDLDGDGFTDLQAYQVGWHFAVVFTSFDMDRDGITDAREAFWGFSMYDPFDATEDHDNDGVLTIEELSLGLNPWCASTMGVPDLDFVNTTKNTTWLPCVSRGSPVTSLDNDTDGDGIPDYWEHKYRLDWRNAADAIRDPDRDGLSNLTEYRFQTHPRIPKTQDNTHDRTRLYATGRPLNAATAGGLMGRYRAQIASGLVNSPVQRDYTLNDVCLPINKWVNDPSSPSSLSSLSSPSSPGIKVFPLPPWMRLTPPNGPGDPDDNPKCACGKIECPECEGTGLVPCSNANCEDGKINCPMKHLRDCELTVPGYCDGHGYRPHNYPHPFFCTQNHSEVSTLICTEPEGGHQHDIFGCYSTFMTCNLSEHGHVPSCDSDGDGMADCGISTHEHMGTCYSSSLSCILPEGSPHDHVDACYSKHVPAHSYEFCGDGGMIACGPASNCIGEAVPCPEDSGEQCPKKQARPCSNCNGTGKPQVEIECDESCGYPMDCLLCEDGSSTCLNCEDKNLCGIDDCDCEGVNFWACPHAPTDILLPEPVHINSSDGAGPRYRKIALNGFPIADSKPQQQDESGELPEETYIDAFTGQLRHSVTDVYVKPDGSELSLSVRRDAAPDVSNRQYGLSCKEKPFLPFGPGWSSNLCAYIKVEGSFYEDPTGELPQESNQIMRPTATVVDEAGATQAFVPKMQMDPDTSRMVVVPNEWVSDGATLSDAKNQKNKLTSTPSGFVLEKKFGTRCFYEEADIGQVHSTDRVNGSWGIVSTKYYRLREVQDRLGNRLIYEYDTGVGTLIPTRISDPARPGHLIQIFHAEGLVHTVRSPDQVDTHYIYTSSPSIHSSPHLTSVVRAGSSVNYEYETNEQGGQEPTEDDPNTYLPYVHNNISSITDERGNRYEFTHEFDESVIVPTVKQGMTSKTVKLGLNRTVKSIQSPQGIVELNLAKLVSAQKKKSGVTTEIPYASMWVKAVDGSFTWYNFTDPHLNQYNRQYNENGLEAATSMLVTYLNMQVARFAPADVQPTPQSLPVSLESYTINPLASMAVATATDLSGNVTSFTYGEEGFDDPISETTYLKNPDGTITPVTKQFEYDPVTRIMTSVTDPMGVRTEYAIDNTRSVTRSGVSIPIRGLKTAEKVFAPDNSLIRETRFYYDNADFPGFVTRSYSISPNPSAMPSSVTVTSFGEKDGANPAWWREVTVSSGPATSSGQLITTSNASITSTTTISDFGGKKRNVIDSRGLQTVFDYDESGRLSRVYHPDGSAKSLGYDAHGNLTSEAEGTYTGTTIKNAVFTPLRTTFHAYNDRNLRVKTAIDLNGNGQPDWTPSTSYSNTSFQPGSGGNSVGSVQYDGDIVTSTVYNVRNQIASQFDSRGGDVTNFYDDVGRLISTSKNGLTSTFEYLDPTTSNLGGSLFDTSAVKPNKTTDPRGVVTEVVYDSLYRIVSTSVSVPGVGGAPPITAVTLTEYDFNGRPVKVTDPLGRVTRTEYDHFGQPVKVTEPDLTANPADNPTIQTFYTHLGKPWKVIDQNGAETLTTYDALGRPVSVQGPVLDAQGTRALTTNEYDSVGNVIRVTDPLGRVTETLFDARNRPSHVYAPTVWDSEVGGFVRPMTESTYDALGQIIESKDPTGAVTTSHYDRAGRKWCVQAPAPDPTLPSAARPTTVTTFDPGGLPLTVTNPLGQTITNTYDLHGRLTKTVDAQGIVNHFTYDAAGNRTSVKDGLNQVTAFNYDGLNRLISQTFANGDTWTHRYNAIQKISQTSPRGIVTSYTYDARDRLLTVNAPAHAASGASALQRNYQYDHAGRLLTVTEYSVASGTSTPNPATSVSYTYDAMGRVTAESSNGCTHQYAYDLVGNRVRAEYSTGRVVETSFDGLNRPEAIAEGSRLTRYGYDLAGRALLLVSPNGQTSLNTYDRLGRLVDRTLFRNPGMAETDVLAEFSWSHDLLGNVTSQYETWPGEEDRIPGLRVTTMGYDANNRLTSEVITQPEVNGATPTTTTLYSYDAANNRSTKTVTRTIAGEEPMSDEDTGHWSYTYNSANQLTAWSKHSAAGSTTVQKSATLTYDAAGNRTSQTVTEVSAPQVRSGLTPPAAQSGTTLYAWDAQDRLSSVTLPSQAGATNQESRTFRYSYDYRTRRVGTSELSSATNTTTKFTAITFSGGLSIAEWESTTTPQPGITLPPTVEYTRGPDMGGGVGGLLYTSRAEEAQPTTRMLRYNLSNGRGDIVAQADSSAALTWTASYEAYGKRTKETGENKDKQRGNSKDEDPTGLLNEGFRYRDIETGVWLSRDPAGFVDGPNLYAYVKQNPWTSWDPHGLATVMVSSNDEDEPEVHSNLVQEEKKAEIDDTTSSIRANVETSKKSYTLDHSKVGTKVTASAQGDKWVAEEIATKWDAYDRKVNAEKYAMQDALIEAAINIPLLLLPGGPLTKGSLTELAVARSGSRSLAAKSAPIPRVTEKGLARIEGHLDNLGALGDDANQAMLARLRSGQTTTHDINFYMHELKESARMKAGLDYDAAHKATLQWQGIPYNAASPAQLYHPDVIRQFSDTFNPAAWPK